MFANTYVKRVVNINQLLNNHPQKLTKEEALETRQRYFITKSYTGYHYAKLYTLLCTQHNVH